MEKYTIEEIKNYIQSQNSFAEVCFNLTEENINKINKINKPEEKVITKEIMEMAVEGKVVLIRRDGLEIKDIKRNRSNYYPYKYTLLLSGYSCTESGNYYLLDGDSCHDIVSYKEI